MTADEMVAWLEEHGWRNVQVVCLPGDDGETIFAERDPRRRHRNGPHRPTHVAYYARPGEPWVMQNRRKAQVQ